ncbi:MAG: YhdP family protein [Propionivibrio sp.]
MDRREDLRPAIDRRFQALAPLLANRYFVRLWRALVWGFWIVYFAFVALVLLLRYSILPNIEAYRPELERIVSQRLGQPVSIGRIEASWEGINPDLTLLDVRVADGEGRPALAFSEVEAILSWWSVPSGQIQLRLLRIDEPALNVRRDAAGQFFVAGIPVGQSDDGGSVPDWILSQRRIRIQGATLLWEDELRGAPPLVLEDVDFALDNDGRQHRFGLTALPPGQAASRIDVRGDLRGRGIERLAAWSGQIFAQIDSVDLATWKQWFDYPVRLPRGHGAFRAWFAFADGKLREATSDVSLRDLSLRLEEALPQLELEHMFGRVSVRLTRNGFEVDGKRVELATRPAVSGAGEALDAEKNPANAPTRIAPMDFHVAWQPLEKGPSGTGEASASALDLGALARLARYLPLDANTRRLLDEYAPRGNVVMLKAKWKGNTDRLQTYSLQAGFDRVALKARGYFPGFTGLTGSVEVTETGGRVSLDAQKPTLDLPGVFPVALIELDSLRAESRWTIDQGVLAVELAHAEFAGPEAAGSAKGTYRNTGSGPGVIDLKAVLSRADARAVWRYMPHAVGEGARHWLRDSLLAGTSNDARLVLRGDLNDFPFLDKRKGEFLVTVKARDVVLDYGKGWPRIDGIDGDLRFEGNGMVVDAQRGTMLGAKLGSTRAEIPDFDKPISTLTVKGRAEGPISEFLKFIEQSPVAERIDHFTENIRATGNGHLDLGLHIPLDEARLGESKIDGTFFFKNNDVVFDDALQPVQQVNGSLQFSGKDLRIPEIGGTLFGGPIKIKGGTQKNGRVLIAVNGTANFVQLRKQASLPLLDNLSGFVPYRGEALINKRDADLVIELTLVGLTSTFPEPFAKAASETLPLRFEKKLLPAASAGKGKAANSPVRDQITLLLGNGGNLMSLQMIRSNQSGGFVTERGAIAVGRPLQLPEKGITLGVTAKKIDLDTWRQALSAGDGAATEASPSMPDSISLRTGELTLFGRSFKDVDLAVAATTPGQMKMYFSSPQASGDLLWDGVGGGKLTARLRKLWLEPSDPTIASMAQKDVEELKELPALDVIADDFALGSRKFGRLELHALNENGAWRLNQVKMNNPYGELSGSGQWQVGGGKSRTLMDFTIDSNDVGKLLERVGYPGTVRGGTAKLEGKLGWNSSPADLDYKSLGGEMNLGAAKGQFVKLDPGAAGKLLGLISLQGLPRRISLDFMDVFSSGFAFDSMTSKLSVKDGVMRTERLQIDGPSARVIMRGEVDLEKETQRLNVNVQPEMGGTAALGVALVNPVAGVATWVAHKILQNPLNQIFGFEYLVTGTWDDPKVDKIARNDAATGQPSAASGGKEEGAGSEPARK